MRILVVLVLLSVSFLGLRPVQAQTTGVCLPVSVMFHSKDRYLLIYELIPWIKENGYETMTYLDLAAVTRGERAMPLHGIIISIDDISTSQINSYFVDMVNALHDSSMKAVIGVNDQVSSLENGETYAVLTTWISWGFEIASHTSNHANLPAYSLEEIRVQIAGSAERIATGTGVRPITLILPYGAGYNDERVIQVSREAGIMFIVGIPGTGRYLGDLTPPIYVPRVPPLSQDVSSVAYEAERWWRFNPECQ